MKELLARQRELTGSIDKRYLPYVREIAAAIYDAGYRKVAPAKE